MQSTQCHHCGYDLTGLNPGGDCPECGKRYDKLSRYQVSHRPVHPIVRYWKAIFLAVVTFLILVGGGLLSLLASKPIGLILLTIVVAALPAFGAVVYALAELKEHRELADRE